MCSTPIAEAHSNIAYPPSSHFHCSKAQPLSMLTESIVRITPIVTRHNGVEYAEMGAGGGNGDLNQVHELEMDDVSALGSLMALCNDKLKDRPEMRQKVLDWLFQSAQRGGRNIKLDTATFFEALHEGDDAVNELDEIPLDRLVLALEKLTKPKAETEAPPECSIVRLPEYCSGMSEFG